MWIMFAQLTLVAACVLISPLSMLPCKDAIEKLVMPTGTEMNQNQNLMCTFGLAIFVFACSIGIKNIADVITITGATSNTIVGFNLPMMFYLKLDTIERGGSFN